MKLQRTAKRSTQKNIQNTTYADSRAKKIANKPRTEYTNKYHKEICVRSIFKAIWTMYSILVEISIASMQSIYFADVFEWMVNKFTNRKSVSTTHRHTHCARGIVIILLLFYLNWSKWNDMHIHKSPLYWWANRTCYTILYKCSWSFCCCKVGTTTIKKRNREQTVCKEEKRNESLRLSLFDCFPKRMKNVWENNWNRNNNNYRRSVVCFFIFFNLL